MRNKIVSVFFLSLILYGAPLLAQGNNPSPRWDGLLDVGYRFTFLPDEDLKEVLASEGKKYGQNLSKYVELWDEIINETTSSEEETMSEEDEDDAFPAAFYRRLAVGQFFLYLSDHDEKNLDAALQTMDMLAKRRQSPRTIFWNNFILAHKSLLQKDSASFSHNVFRIWTDVVLVLERGQLMFGSSVGATGFSGSLPYLYENLAHLILNQGIVKHKVPNLHALGAIIWALKDRLTVNKGYYPLAESIWNRMSGATSDRFSINFAMMFLEGEMHWINFEDAKTAKEAAASFALAKSHYDLALKWANTSKGKAATLNKLLQSMMRIINGMSRGVETVNVIAADDIPGISEQYVSAAKDLFRKLSPDLILNEGLWTEEGFNNRDNFLSSMHELWANIAQLNVVTARYYSQIMDKTRHPVKKIRKMSKVIKPYSSYLTFFEEFTQADHKKIVPDNAYFYAAYMASEIASLHRMKATYSEDSKEHELAFARQLQAIEIFPFDIVGLIELSVQVSQEGLVDTYIDNVWPLIDRFKKSHILKSWAKSKYKKAYLKEALIMQKVIPKAIKSTPSVIGLQDTSKNESELIKETLFLTQLLNGLLLSDVARKADDILENVAEQLRAGGKMTDILKKTIPKNVFNQIAPEIALIEKYNYGALKRTLFRNLDDERHALFRGLYHEVPASELKYLQLLKVAKEDLPITKNKPFPSLKKMTDEE